MTTPKKGGIAPQDHARAWACRVSLEPRIVLYAIADAECLAPPADEATANAVEVGEEVEDVAEWGFDE